MIIIVTFRKFYFVYSTLNFLFGSNMKTVRRWFGWGYIIYTISLTLLSDIPFNSLIRHHLLISMEHFMKLRLSFLISNLHNHFSKEIISLMKSTILQCFISNNIRIFCGFVSMASIGKFQRILIAWILP